MSKTKTAAIEKTNIGTVLELLLETSHVWLSEEQKKGFEILKKTKVLVLGKSKTRNLYKILVLTGEHAGRICYESSIYVCEPLYYCQK